MFKYKLSEDAKPANEDFVGAVVLVYMIFVWSIIIGSWAIPKIRDWLAKRRWERENPEEAEKMKTSQARYKKFLSSGIGALTRITGDTLDYSQGGYPLKDTWIDLDSEWDGLWTPKQGRNPQCTAVSWKDLIDRITRIHGALREISFASLTDNAESKTKQIISKYFGSVIKVAKNKETMSMHMEPLKTYTAKFATDVWFNFNRRYTDLKTLCEVFNEMTAIFIRIEELREKCCSGDIDQLPDNEIKNRGLLLKFIELIEALCYDLYNQVHPIISQMGNAIAKDCDVDKDVSDMTYGHYLRPSNYVEPEYLDPDDF